MAVVKRAVDAVAAMLPGQPGAQGRHPARGEPTPLHGQGRATVERRLAEQ